VGPTRAAEAEVFDASGQRLLAQPGTAPVEHWPSAGELARLRAGEGVTVGPIAGDSARVLSYANFLSGDVPVTGAGAPAVPDLVEAMHEHRQLLVGHVAALFIVLAAG